MAKWGEGDPRWIVEERQDSHNVNNWHWKEVDANKWSEERLSLLFGDISIADGPFQMKIKKMSSCTGESMASNRKNKLICYWDYELELKWECVKKINANDKITVCGTIKCPNFSQENDIDDDVDLSSTKIDKDEVHDNEVLKFVKSKGHRAIRSAMKQYGDDLRKDFAAKVCQVPNRDDKPKEQIVTTPTAPKDNQAKKEINKIIVDQKETGAKIKTKKLILKETFMCSCEDFYNVFTERPKVDAWSRGAQTYNVEKNGQFVMFSGNVTGSFIELETNKKIKMSWRLKHWPQGHHSEATMELTQTDKGTRMTLTQTGVPENDVERTKQGWKNFYWNPIKFTFGFGVEIS